MSVIWFVLSLLHIMCLSERQLLLTNDLEPIRFDDMHTLMLL